MITTNLQPGDALMYAPSGFFGWAIAIKTYTKIAHISIYAGDGQSWASRDGKGVGLYPFRESKLAYVLRPTVPLDLLEMAKWFETVDGQGYDWLGIARFIAWGSIGTGNNGRQFCSEFACRLFRAGGFDPFAGADADAISPAAFLINPLFTKVQV